MTLYLNAHILATAVELCPLVIPQANVSSEGDTYVDAVGNTYAETVNQTRITVPTGRVRQVACRISALVSANTGTVQLYNASDNTSLGTKTTTSAVEAVMDIIQSSTAFNAGDEVTLRVKNSNAGQSMTIVSGGMIDGDQATDVYAGNTRFGCPCGGFPRVLSFVVVKALSTTTYRVQPAAYPSPGSARSLTVFFGTSYTDSSSGVVQSVRVPYRLQPSSSYGIATLSAIGNAIIAMSASLAGELS